MDTMRHSATDLFFLLLLGASTAAQIEPYTEDPTPARWPDRFHALLYRNLTGSLQVADQWYDWPRGRNFYLIQKQLGPVIYNVEWNNGTSFYFTLAGEIQEGGCRVVRYGVGIPRPDFLNGSVYLGTRWTDGFFCNLWQKVDFIWYYEDVSSRRPVRWDFNGISVHVMTFEVGVELNDPDMWQAPSYCFVEGNGESEEKKNKEGEIV
ncbi:hypothetical protein HPP92_011261 [Vanilla planifolia]|uniref:Transferring glycosyl group transferase n=1 Tax=Vanilla planifolia TaxID=51239 RepID=A0A835RC20_VANPL|nr:hypothetical protein HPP92_011261 [Vanilla planifolia]